MGQKRRRAKRKRRERDLPLTGHQSAAEDIDKTDFHARGLRVDARTKCSPENPYNPEAHNSNFTAADQFSCPQVCPRFAYDAVILTRETDQNFAFKCKVWLEENLSLPCGSVNHRPKVELMVNIRPESYAGSLGITPHCTRTVILLCTKGFESDALFTEAMNDIWPLKSQGLKLIPLLSGFGMQEVPPVCIPVLAAHKMRWENRNNPQFRDAMIKCLSFNLGSGFSHERHCVPREVSRTLKQPSQPTAQQPHSSQPLTDTQTQTCENQAQAAIRNTLLEINELDSGFSSSCITTSSSTSEWPLMPPDRLSGPDGFQNTVPRPRLTEDRRHAHGDKDVTESSTKGASSSVKERQPNTCLNMPLTEKEPLRKRPDENARQQDEFVAMWVTDPQNTRGCNAELQSDFLKRETVARMSFKEEKRTKINSAKSSRGQPMDKHPGHEYVRDIPKPAPSNGGLQVMSREKLRFVGSNKTAATMACDVVQADKGVACRPKTETTVVKYEETYSMHLEDTLLKRYDHPGATSKAEPPEPKRSIASSSALDQRRKTTEATKCEAKANGQTLSKTENRENHKAEVVSGYQDEKNSTPAYYEERLAGHESVEVTQKKELPALREESSRTRRDLSPTPSYINVTEDMIVKQTICSDEGIDLPGIIHFCNEDAADSKSPDVHSHYDNKHHLTVDMRPTARDECVEQRQNDTVTDGERKIRVETFNNQRSGLTCKTSCVSNVPQKGKSARGSEKQSPGLKLVIPGPTPHLQENRWEHCHPERKSHNAEKTPCLIELGIDNGRAHSPDDISQRSSAMHIEHVGILNMYNTTNNYNNSTDNSQNSQRATKETGIQADPPEQSPGVSSSCENLYTDHIYENPRSPEEPYVVIPPPVLPARGPKQLEWAKLHEDRNRKRKKGVNGNAICKLEETQTGPAYKKIVPWFTSSLRAALCCIRRKKLAKN